MSPAGRSAKGPINSILRYLKTTLDKTPPEFRQAVERIAMSGGTPLAVADKRTCCSASFI